MPDPATFAEAPCTITKNKKACINRNKVIKKYIGNLKENKKVKNKKRQKGKKQRYIHSTRETREI